MTKQTKESRIGLVSAVNQALAFVRNAPIGTYGSVELIGTTQRRQYKIDGKSTNETYAARTYAAQEAERDYAELNRELKAARQLARVLRNIATPPQPALPAFIYEITIAADENPAGTRTHPEVYENELHAQEISDLLASQTTGLVYWTEKCEYEPKGRHQYALLRLNK